MSKQELSVRLVHDKNWPKLQIDAMESQGFHTEFSVAWQNMSFNPRKSLLIVRGKSEAFPNGYKLHLHLRGKRASRDA